MISKFISVLYLLGSQSKYTDTCLFFLDTLLPDIVSLIAYAILLWVCIKKMAKNVMMQC